LRVAANVCLDTTFTAPSRPTGYSHTMDRRTFVKLVGKHEQIAARNPGMYRFGIFLFAILGYVYILFLLALAIGILVLLFFVIRSNTYLAFRAAYLAIPLVLFAYAILSSLVVSVPEPTGVNLMRSDAAPLFIEIDRIRTRLGLPRFDRVIISREFNAAVAQIPRLGLFGWHKNILIIGLPIMCSLPPDCFRAILAHEMGHVSGSHGKFGSWVFRINEMWMQLLENVQVHRRGAQLVAMFFAWYVPRFNAYSLALRKSHEYVADRTAAETIGAKIVAEALIRMELVHVKLSLGIERAVTPSQANQILSQVFSRQSGPLDSHPSLIERLNNIRQEPVLPGDMTETAAQKYLAHKLPGIVQFLNIGLD
jgi:Zn-dependent protease with chaperone function